MSDRPLIERLRNSTADLCQEAADEIQRRIAHGPEHKLSECPACGEKALKPLIIHHCEHCGSDVASNDDTRLNAEIQRLTADAARPQTQAARDVLAERTRQVEVEGWTPEHDDKHCGGEMSGAAAAYALHDLQGGWFQRWHRQIWPWSLDWWRPADRRRNLVKAGALILAEIERLDRAAVSTEGAK